jgi:hypothetical protein
MVIINRKLYALKQSWVRWFCLFSALEGVSFLPSIREGRKPKQILEILFILSKRIN